jgi:hypothetical protein
VNGFLKPGNGIIALQTQVLHTDPLDQKAWAELTLVALGGQMGMLEMEVSRGRISAQDLKTLLNKSRALIGRMVGVSSFQVRASFQVL